MNPRRGRLRRTHTALAAAFFVSSFAQAQEGTPTADPSPPARLGPSEIRDEHLLAQPRLTLPATTPDTLGRGQTAFRASALWSNSFGWNQDQPGEQPEDRRFLVDGETATLDLTLTHGFRANLDAGIRLPLAWRGGGRLDGVIDAWHRLFNLPDGNRPDFVSNAFRAEGRTIDQQPFSWNQDGGLGLGPAEVFARWRFVDGPRWTSALVGRLALPTGTGAFAGNGTGLGLQWVGARRLGSSFDAFLGVGGTTQAAQPVRGVGYERFRGHAFLALEWRPARRLSLAAESDIATRLVRDVDRYPGTHWIVHGALRLALTDGAQLELGFTENFADQIVTTDVAFQLGVRIRTGARRGSTPSGPAPRQ